MVSALIYLFNLLPQLLNSVSVCAFHNHILSHNNPVIILGSGPSDLNNYSKWLEYAIIFYLSILVPLLLTTITGAHLSTVDLFQTSTTDQLCYTAG